MTAIVLSVSLLVMHTLVAAYDIYAAYFLPTGSTVSAVLQEWAIKFPAMPLVIGFVLGHLFWPVRR